MRFQLASSLLPLLTGFLWVSPTFATPARPSQFQTRLVYEFPIGVWLENLAVRRSGSVLATELTAPNLYQIDPLVSNPTSSLVCQFPNGTAVFGITETVPDTFYVTTFNGSLTRNPDGSITTIGGVPGSSAVYRVSFPIGRKKAKVDYLTTVSGSGALNGLTTLNFNTILAADSLNGVIWAIDTRSGASKIALTDPLMQDTGTGIPSVIGANGIKILGNDGSRAGPTVVVANTPTGGWYDDFVLDPFGNAFLTTAVGNTIVEVSGGRQKVIAGSLNSTEIAQATAVAFGRTFLDSDILYVTTTGGLVAPINGNQTVGGQLVAINLNKLG